MPEHEHTDETTTDETLAADVREGEDVSTSVDTSPTGDTEPDTFPREYVQRLRDESARYRQRAGRADELHRRLVETTIRSVAADHLADPVDLLMFSDEADLLDEDGFPDADKIVAAAKALVTRRPHLARRRPHGDIGQGATRTEDPANLAGILRARAI